MKKTLLFTMMCAFAFANAQQATFRNLIKNETNINFTKTKTANLLKANTSSIEGIAKSMVSCTDKVNYVGTAISTLPDQVGGFYGWEGLYEVYPYFTGQVTRIDFTAAKITNNYTVKACVYSLSGGVPGTLLGSVNVTVNGAVGEYGAALPSAINVTNGFVVGIEAILATDSVKVTESPDGTGNGDNFCFGGIGGNYYSFFNDLTTSYDMHALIRPTIKFNSVVNTLNVSPSTTCAATPINFTGLLGTTTANYFSNIYNPSGVTETIDFGDATSPYSGSVTSHSYASSGTYTPAYNATYVGWTNNCVSAPATSTVTVNPACTPLFSWSSVNLAVTFNNLSIGATSCSWLFGDAGTSSSMTTVVHNYAASGSYTVELTANGPCGTNLYTATISITDSTSGGNIGITEISNPQTISIYPNPSTNVLNVSYDIINTNDNTTIAITDDLGRTILSQNIGASSKGIVTFDISQLSNATYYVSTLLNGKQTARPFVKGGK